jgi:hypothetical protein
MKVNSDFDLLVCKSKPISHFFIFLTRKTLETGSEMGAITNQTSAAKQQNNFKDDEEQHKPIKTSQAIS